MSSPDQNGLPFGRRLDCDSVRRRCSAPYDGGKATNPKDLKGKKVVLADIPKLIGIGYFNATAKGIAEGCADLTKAGLPTEVTTDGPTVGDIQKQIEFIDNAISRGVDGIFFAANDPVAISPVLRKALKAGIHVIGYDAESAAGRPRMVCTNVHPGRSRKSRY